MTRPIVVPLDGSPFAEHALARGVSLARRNRCPLQLVMVVTPTIAPRFAEHMTEAETARHEEARKSALAYLNEVAARVTGESGLSVTVEVHMGPISEALDRHIKANNARLIVLTSHGRGAIQRAWLGSVTDGLVRRTPAPVLIVRPRDGESPPEVAEDFRHILIPLDGSPAARAVLEPIVALAGTERVSYTLLRVLVAPRPVPSTYLPHVADENRRMADARREAEDLLSQRRGELEAHGATVNTRVVEHPSAAPAILELATELGADLIAMTTEGLGGVARLFVGSVADKVIRGSEIPVLVTRRTED